MNGLLKVIHDTGIVPVIAIDDAKKAVPLAKALIDGGLPAAEVTFRTEAAEEAIRSITAEIPEMLVGAGTVLTKDQADRATDAGARFIVSPGFNPVITKYVLGKGVLMIPGTETAGEMEQAMMMGLTAVKFFPAEQNGGIAKLKALAGPYRDLMWMPTGGINTDNLADYMSFPQILACGGTWMVKKDLIENERWDDITAICKSAVKTMLGFELVKAVNNSGNEDEAEQTARKLSLLFGFDVEKGDVRGTGGHIMVSTYNVDRAVYHLRRSGAVFDESTKEEDGRGIMSIYMDDETGGITVRLIRKNC